MVENQPANAGDTGSSPGPGRFHMLRSNKARVPQLLSLCPRACEPQLLKPVRLEPMLRNKRRPHSLQLEKAHAQQGRPNAAKNKQKNKQTSLKN